MNTKIGLSDVRVKHIHLRDGEHALKKLKLYKQYDCVNYGQGIGYGHFCRYATDLKEGNLQKYLKYKTEFDVPLEVDFRDRVEE